jgi:hypothetical protein
MEKPPIDDDRSRTVREFCAIENLSVASYYKMKKQGLAPDELRVPGLSIVRITAQAHREWRERMTALRQEEAAAREHERRRAATSRAGKLAAASPRHPCRRKRLRT